ncbi:FAD/NAD(P)-binding domain-containing protein [Venturia nashicola]|uniref:FAD/NAD(P)-binding domain-containing protein n=1 Tax=Venturia nashicola TaxID=86259 RepID=A0A4Z1PBN1_9PEZI|nr:FAD/NAD(P)-binding domain-containing protein [Venturia nashicola]
MLRQALKSGAKPHVCIIGAGFAGLRCADILLQQGVKVTIFEARSRIGGRLCQATVGDHLVDLGPNWIHGTENNPILDLVKKTETQTHSWGERQVTYDPEGNLMPEEEVAKVSESMWELIGKAFKHSNSNSATIPASESLLDFIKDHADEQIQEPFPIEYQATEDCKNGKVKMPKKELMLSLSEQWGSFVGGAVETQSLKFFWLEECLDGENLFCAGTYAKVLELVAKPVLVGADVRFEHVVTKITSKKEDGNPRVTLETANGVLESFDEVVVTAPLGWLKRNQDVFEPNLPERIAQGIESLGYGNLDKVYITFPKAFWNEPVSSSQQNGHLPSKRQNIPNTTATTAPLHQPASTATNDDDLKSSVSNPSEQYPGFTNFLAPHYAKSTNPSSWQQEALNLAAMPQNSAHPTLLFYTAGQTSKHIASLLTTHASSPFNLHAALWSFFHPYISLLPNYSALNPDCKPIDILATGWANDEFAGYGSYTNFPTGLERGDQDVLALREGVPERGVWFAGEHTAPFVALGTVTGAYWAGEGVGRRILDGYGFERGDGVGGKGGSERREMGEGEKREQSEEGKGDKDE